MSEIKFHLADVSRLVNENDRATISGHLGAWMMKVGRLVSGVKAVEIGWSTAGGRPTLGPTDILVYITSDVERSIIEANGGDATEARSNTNLLGLTAVEPSIQRSLSEVYFGRAAGAKAVAGAAFHEAAHNKSLLDNVMHNEKNGLLIAAPVYGSNPTQENIEFFAKHVLAKVTQQVISQNTLNNAWYGR